MFLFKFYLTPFILREMNTCLQTKLNIVLLLLVCARTYPSVLCVTTTERVNRIVPPIVVKGDNFIDAPCIISVSPNDPLRGARS